MAFFYVNPAAEKKLAQKVWKNDKAKQEVARRVAGVSDRDREAEGPDNTAQE